MPSFGENSSTNSLKLTRPSPVRSALAIKPTSSRSVAKKPFSPRKSRSSSTETKPRFYLSICWKALFMLK